MDLMKIYLISKNWNMPEKAKTAMNTKEAQHNLLAEFCKTSKKLYFHPELIL